MYGYSIWLIPDDYEYIKKTYKMKHIPHITFSTNHREPQKVLDNKSYLIKLKGKFLNFPKMYAIDPLNACGFYCDTDMKTTHDPHMSIFYDFVDDIDLEPLNKIFSGKLYSVDTTSNNPSNWHII